MNESNELPLIKSARREAIAAFCIWIAATTYSVGVCYAYRLRVPVRSRDLADVRAGLSRLGFLGTRASPGGCLHRLSRVCSRSSS